MKTHNDYAFEVCYDATGAVVDHSELYFSDLPDASEFEKWLGEVQANPDAVRIVRHHADLLPVFRRWVMSPKADESFVFGDAQFELAWRSPERGTGVLFLSRAGHPKIGTLLLTGIERVAPVNLLGPDDIAESEFLEMLKTRFGQSPFDRTDALKLVRLTRRPLVATVFWPPRAAEDSDVRTVQRMLAFQFFAAHGVIRPKPTLI